MRKALLILLGLVVLLGAAVFIVPALIDWNRWKPELADAVRGATGQQLRIDGNLSLALVPTLAFHAEGVHLTADDGTEVAAVGVIDGRIATWSLLFGSLMVDRLVVTAPKLTLTVDRNGHANWQAPDTEANKAAPAAARRDGASPLPFGEVHLGEVRIEDGAFAFTDARTGQSLKGSGIKLDATMNSLAETLGVRLDLTLNGKPVAATASVDSPRALLGGRAATIKAELKAEPVTLLADGSVKSSFPPAASGRFNLDVPSVGALLAWLGRPLPAGQPDPGKITARARIVGEGDAFVIEEAVIDGAALALTATGRVNLAGTPPSIRLEAKSGVLDLDRYLPPPPAAPTAAAPVVAARPAQPAPAGPLLVLPDEPIDVTFLRNLDADVKVALGGLRARGWELGAVNFTATARNGALAAELKDLVFNGGRVNGTLRVDASAAEPRLQATMEATGVVVDRLLASGGQPPAAKGPVTLKLTASAAGRTPRALVEAMQGEVTADLGRLELAALPPRMLTGLTAKATLPGRGARPTLAANATYNGRKVDATATLDELPKLLSGERFAAAFGVAADTINAKFDGRVGLVPAPAIDGALDLDVPSVAALIGWLGQPGDAPKSDPGALRLKANLASTGTKTTLTGATLEGKALKARLAGSADLGAAVKVIEAKLNIDQADLDAYLPAQDAAQPAARGAAPAPAPAAGWDATPIDFAALKQYNAKVEVTLAAVKYRGLAVDAGAFTTNLQNGLLDSVLSGVRAAGGTASGSLKLDGAAAVPKLDLGLKVQGVEGQALLAAFAGSDRISGKADLDLDLTATGRSQKEFIDTLAGGGGFRFLDGALHGFNLAATLRQAQSLGFDRSAAATQKTDFAELSGTFKIAGGIVTNDDLKLLAPLVRVTGAGKIPLPPRTIDYVAEAKLVGSLQGQQGQEALAGIPIPIRVTGPWDRIAYDIDYNAVLRDAARDPERLRQLPKDLIDRARGFGLNLGGPSPAPAPAPTQPGARPAPAPTTPDVLAPLRNLLGR